MDDRSQARDLAISCVSFIIDKMQVSRSLITHTRVIGQNVLVKTAVVIVISMATAVISFLKEDTGWTKRVGKIA